jgi:hypothetical protein
MRAVHPVVPAEMGPAAGFGRNGDGERNDNCDRYQEPYSGSIMDRQHDTLLDSCLIVGLRDRVGVANGICSTSINAATPASHLGS